MTDASPRLRSPLGRVLGLGSAKEGAEHWWGQRLTSVALLPLSLWFVVSAIGLIGADHGEVRAWLAHPLSAVMMLLLVFVTLHHTNAGVQVVIEDYVHAEGVKLLSLVAVRFVCIAVGVAGLYATLTIAAFGG